MNALASLIRKLCPNGVERKTLGECCAYLSKEALPQKDLIEQGQYPVVNSSRNIYGRFNQYNNDADAVIVASHGEYAGFVSQISGKFWAGALCHPIAPQNSLTLHYRYLFHSLKVAEPKIVATLVARGSIPVINKSDMMRFSIPLPPLTVQEEISRRLDAMQEVVEALETELALRRKQYEAVRERLLGWLVSETTYKLKDVFDFKNGYTPSKDNPKFWDEGTIPWFRMEDIRENGRILSDSILHITESAVKGALFPANSLLLSTSATIGEYAFLLVPALANQRFTCLSPKASFRERIYPRYIFHFAPILSLFCLSHIHVGNFNSVDMNQLRELDFQLPSLVVQKEIAAELDVFDELVNIALPAEIAARRRVAEAVREECFAALEAAE